jgi:hypothetical protein
MRKIIVTNNLTLDGVMQAPGRPDEDARGGFTHGGGVADNTQKHMVSSTLNEPLPWKSSSLLGSTDAVATLKQQPGKDLVIIATYHAQ